MTGIDKKNGYTRPAMPEEKKFFAKRGRNWVLHPENNPELMEEIRNGKRSDLQD